MIDPRKFLKNRTVLVTGGAGFIGSHLCDHLMNYGARVVCFDDLSTGSKNYVDSQRGNKKFFFIKGDVNKLTDIKNRSPSSGLTTFFITPPWSAFSGPLRSRLKFWRILDGIRYILDLSHKNKVKSWCSLRHPRFTAIKNKCLFTKRSRILTFVCLTRW